MVHIEARLQRGPSVRVDGPTLASAVRAATRKLGLGPGRTVSRQQATDGSWTWNWSGTVLRVAEIPEPSPRGRPPSALTGDWLALAEACGGAVGLARELGVSTQSVWRWATGKQRLPKIAALALGALASARGLRAPGSPRP